jgi:hypothetical protein
MRAFAIAVDYDLDVFVNTAKTNAFFFFFKIVEQNSFFSKSDKDSGYFT